MPALSPFPMPQSRRARTSQPAGCWLLQSDTRSLRQLSRLFSFSYRFGSCSQRTGLSDMSFTQSGDRTVARFYRPADMVALEMSGHQTLVSEHSPLATKACVHCKQCIIPNNAQLLVHL